MNFPFWVVLVAYLVKTAGFFWLLRRNRLLSSHNRDLDHFLRQTLDSRRRIKADSDNQAAEFRAMHRDLITQYERLHAKYRELQNDSTTD